VFGFINHESRRIPTNDNQIGQSAGILNQYKRLRELKISKDASTIKEHEVLLSEDEEHDDDDYFGLPKARSKGSKKRKNGTESNSRSINNNNKLTTMQGSRKNKKRLMKASIIERTLEINMPCISNKIAIGLERNTFIEP